MRQITLILFTLFLFPSLLYSQNANLKNKYGQNQRLQWQQQQRCLRQYDRFGRIQQSYRLQQGRVYQFNQKGGRK